MCIIIFFGFGRPPDDPRMEVRAEPYHTHRTRHIIAQSMDGIGTRLMERVREAYEPAVNK